MGGRPRQPSLLFALENHAKRVGHVVDDQEEERGALHRIYSSGRCNDIRMLHLQRHSRYSDVRFL
jgi:hypothetical protein